jgi:hypothetical protein
MTFDMRKTKVGDWLRNTKNEKLRVISIRTHKTEYPYSLVDDNSYETYTVDINGLCLSYCLSSSDVIGFWEEWKRADSEIKHVEILQTNTNNPQVIASKEVIQCVKSNNPYPEKSEPEKKMLLPTDPKERKDLPIVSGFLDYFPLASAAVAKLSKIGNDQHNPNQPLHWDKTKSTDHIECIGRHLIDRDKFDTDGVLHAVKLAWRAMAYLQIEAEKGTKLFKD